jgi:hypothetical protein
LDKQRSAIDRIRHVLLIQTQLPCGATHHLFNHLGGLLKGLSREKASNSLQVHAIVLPTAAALTPLVSEFSLSSLRKNKSEPLFLSSGSFW